ncbi:hypothetical protein [Actinoplanes flavus]|uniref:Uncharacterized protein n=1 Tax=Actinoplanes flavus TaxID=2820290 RepID=A0ABS3UWV3_9ACTN|nr:hypothetical protein [Actinoplanes flavus]MBO3743053.1 hypothetical protein [Actinoplanes flavus]
MTPAEQNLVWLGYEDYTGLWQAALEVEDRDVARRIVASLLSRGWIELYFTDGLWDNETIAVVPVRDRMTVLEDVASWSVEGGGRLIWFATTDEGYDAYRKAEAARR